MTTLIIILNILAIATPFVIAYSTFKLSNIEDYQHKKKKILNQLIYISTSAVILFNIGIWILNREENKNTRIENQRLSEQNARLLAQNQELLTKSENLYNDQKSLFKENLIISESNSNLSYRLEQIKQIISQKDDRIGLLENQVKDLKLSSPKIDNQGRIAASPFVTLASEFSDGIQKSKELFIKGEFKKVYDITTDLINKKSDFGLAYFLRGSALAQLFKYADAMKEFNNAVKYGLDNSDLTWCYHNMAICEIHENNLESAYKYFMKCYNIDADFKQSKDIFLKLKKELKK